MAVVSFGALLVLTVAAVMALSRADAAAELLSCGTTITADTKLGNDLVDCPNNGIIIAADHVTLDLNGHRIDGDGTPDSACDPVTDFCDFGVAFERHDGITVKNGSIREFEGGLLALKSRETRLVGLSTARNTFGNIGIAASVDVLVRDCSGNRSISNEGNGLGLFDSRRIRVIDCAFNNNHHVGIKSVGSTDALIKGNAMADNGDEGLLMEGGKGFEIKGNHLDALRTGGGITLGPGTANVIQRNVLRGGWDGIRIEKGHDNLVARNTVVHARNAGIRLGIRFPLLGGSHNLIRNNLVKGSRGQGFLVDRKDRHSRLIGNVARGARANGFEITSPSARLKNNRAKFNGNLGIRAVRGVKDGGGNVAHHNFDYRQCTGRIVCN